MKLTSLRNHRQRTTLKSTKDKAMGFVPVIRDSNGVFQKFVSGHTKLAFATMMAERLAVRKVLSWLKALQLHKIIVEWIALRLFMR
ncbi:hypothetical protein V6N12_029819 [Hibiscus sabdariffa]|uniref:RNase H type-1 domain-containing protein n=1 Tax=Hibiscus sabdariffa TaxID=183260 RepID=A0ABR2CY12_9ROSI